MSRLTLPMLHFTFTMVHDGTKPNFKLRSNICIMNNYKTKLIGNLETTYNFTLNEYLCLINKINKQLIKCNLNYVSYLTQVSLMLEKCLQIIKH